MSTNEPPLKITGLIIDRKTKATIPGLRVEAWDKDLLALNMGGSALADANGSFKIEFDPDSFREHLLTRRPLLFFSVFRDEKVQNTRALVVWNEALASTEIVIEGAFISDQIEPLRLVKGKVLFADGFPAARLVVTAVNRDLRQEQQLGHGTTNSQGFYEIHYGGDQSTNAQAGIGSLIVKAFAANGLLLVASQPLFNPPAVAEVDLTIPLEVQAPPPLFEKIGSAIAPLLGGVQVRDLNEDESHHDVSFLSGRTGLEKAVVARYVLAHKLAQDHLAPEFWFALLDNSIFQFAEDQTLDHLLKTVTDSLSSLDAAAVRNSLARAFDRNEIPQASSDQIEEWVEFSLKFVASRAVGDSAQPSFLGSAAAHAGITDRQLQEKFALLYNQYKANTPDLIAALQNDASFSQEQVADLHTSFQLAELTQGDFSVVKVIKDEFEIRQPEGIRTLAKKSQSEWVNLVNIKLATGEIKLPIEIRAAADSIQLPAAEVYGRTLDRQFREAYPTTAFAGGLERALSNGGVRGLLHAEALGSFLAAHQDFELLRTPVDDFLKNNVHPEFTQLAGNIAFLQEMKAVQRVFKLAPTFEAADVLLAAGLHSAQQIYRLGESQFVQRYGLQMDPNVYSGSPNTSVECRSAARMVWNRAADTHAAATTIIADLKALDPNSLPQVLLTGGQALTTFPNWESLFQTGDLCDCEACRSVIGPAAYFADLLMYLKDRQAADHIATVKDILFRRRPDLGYLELNCENALTPLPYIDVVCEVLEAAIAADENDVEIIGLTNIPDTSATTKTAIANALKAASLDLGADFSLSQVNLLDPDRWVAHGDRRTYLLKKKTTVNFFAEVLRNTKAKADELRANPQYVNPRAYEKLREAQYPMALPFDLFAEEVRAGMQKTNLQRWDLMTTLRGNAIPNNPSDGEIAAEYFGISVGTAALRFNGTMTSAQRTTLLSHASLAAVTGIPPYQDAVDELFTRGRYSPVNGLPSGFTFPAVITGAPNNIPISYAPFRFDEKGLMLVADASVTGQRTVWGEPVNANWLDVTGNVPDSLCIVKNFLRKTGLEYNELLTLLDLKFVNPAADIAIHHLDTSCDTAKKVIDVLDETKLDRIHRFLRLWRKLKGWKMWEVDLVIRHPGIGNNQLDEAFLINLFYFARLKDRLGKKATVEHVCALFGDLNTETRFTKLHEPRADALYQQLFLNRRLINPLDPAFALDPTTGDLPPGQTIPAHRPVITTALGVSESDLVSFEESKKFTDGLPYLNHDLTLASLSFLWRHSWLSKVLKFKADEWQTVLTLWLMDLPAFLDPKSAWQFVTLADQLKATGFTPDELNWLLMADRSAKAAVKETDVARFLSAVRKDLQKIHAENDPSQYAFLTVATPTDEGQLTALLTTLLEKLNRDETELSFFLAALRGSVLLESKVLDLPAGFSFPAAIIVAPNNIPIHYDEPSLMLRCAGLMTKSQRKTLLDETEAALIALRATGQLETPVQGLPLGFVVPSTIADNIAIQYDEPNLMLRFTGLMTDAQRKTLLDETEAALIALRATGQLETPVQGLPLGFVVPSTIADNIPIQYDEPNLMLRFTGLMTDAERKTLLDETEAALIALRATGQLETPVQGLPLGFVVPSTIADNIPIQYDEPNLMLRFTGLMTDAQRAILRTDPFLAVVTAIPNYLTAIEDLYQQSVKVVTTYQAGINDLYQQSVKVVTTYQAGINDLYQQSVKVVTSYQAGIDDLYQHSLAATTSYAFTESETALPGGLTLPANQPSLPVTYNPTTKAPGFIGVMTEAQWSDLIADNPTASAIIDELFQTPRLAQKFYESSFSAPLAHLPPAVDFKAQLPADLAVKISYDEEQRLLRFAGIMSANDQMGLDALVAASELAYHDAITSLFKQPRKMLPTDERVWLTDGDLDPTQPASDTLAKRLANAAAKALRYLSRALATEAVVQQSSAQLKLTEAMTRLLLTKYAVVSISSFQNKPLLDYLTQDFAATTQVVDYSSFKGAFDAWFWAARVAALWKKWKITLAEWEQLTVIAPNSRLLDIETLPLKQGPPFNLPIFLTDRFMRMSRLLRLRDSLPQTNIKLLEILEKLNKEALTPSTYSRADFADDVERLNENWPAADVLSLVGASPLTGAFDLVYPTDYLLVEGWERLSRAFDYLDTLNAGPDLVKTFAAPAMSDVHAQTLRELLRSKFGSETWLTLSTEIQDVLRERKRDALAAFLLTKPPTITPSGKWENTNDLYAYYLLDIEMSSCQLTSRLVQASGSVQLFVQRCFMGLEPAVKVQADGATGDSAWRWWKWMRKYQVWVANRKVFLWPENWIEPELKPDRSQFFKDLENELLQNEIDQSNVETAFANYLEKLDGVAQLEIAGFFQEDDGDNAIVHVFGRTKGAEPHIYYYRRYDYRQWTPWEKVDLDIQGDYLIPAVVNRELFLFWPVFTEVPNEQGNSSVATPTAGQESVPVQKTKKNLRLQMAVSDYRKGKWTPKRISTDFALSQTYDVEIVRKQYWFYPIDRSEIDGRFGIRFEGHSSERDGSPRAALSGAFEIAGCKGVPALASLPGKFRPGLRPDMFSAGATTSFQRWLELGPLPARPDKENDFSLESYGWGQITFTKVLVETPWLFRMTPAWHLSYFDKLLLNGLEGRALTVNDPFLGQPLGTWLPFFYDDRKRTFFVLPAQGRFEFNYGAHWNFRSYYPEIKKMLRGREDDYECQIEEALARLDLHALPSHLRDLVEQFLKRELQEERNPPYSDTQLKALLKRFYMRSVHWSLGTQAMASLQFRQFHFKNFYHPFVCDFAKLVYNPLKGIPALMSRETQLQDSGFSFRQSYVPTSSVVSPPTEDFYPKEIVDFSPDGSYSSYNWELFFHAPLLIANSLSKNQRFEEARDWYHFIFNPIGVESSMPGAPAMSKFWITKPFFETTDTQFVQQRIDNILGLLAGNANPGLENQVLDWRTHPFEPHRIANYRTVAYQKTTVMKYLDNLIAWGDNLFRQDSMESINEATQLYVAAAELLGPPPKNVPPQAKPPLETFNELEKQFDKFSNALVEVENLVPPLSGNANAGNPAPLPTLYFCIPHNEKMLGYWNTVADRLYKIRHCMNIEGVVRQLALFEPPIDPGALVKAVAGGVDISAALADLNAPLPIYRFNVFLQKANEVCNDVKALGGALLSALEKKDAEALALLRGDQEIRLLEAVKAVREKQIEEAKENLEGAKRSRVTVETRRNYYRDIERLSTQEKLHLDKLSESHKKQEIAQGVKLAASVLSYLPDIDLGASGFGGTPLAKFKIGGLNLGQAVGIAGDVISLLGQMAANDSIMASSKGSFDRRWDDWKLQERLAEKELDQMDRQIAAAELRVAIAGKELENHVIQIENAKATDAFMRSKFTNQELYQWQVGQISAVYFQSHNLAYDLAKRAERCFRFELGVQDSSYINFGYWDSLKKGLLSGERLQYDLRRLETAYLDQNRREFELTKHVSLALLDPLALIRLRETGRCFFQLPEEIFDLDYPGHYFRRIKSVSLTLPCVTGPYTTISCTLRLLSSKIRLTTDVQNDVQTGYRHNEDSAGLPVDDPRFIENNIPVKAIAASSAQNDSGVFELNFRDDRYLPFEGGGVISGWALELFTDLPANNPDPTNPDFGSPLRQFDYTTISDAIVHVKYTDREDAGLFKNSAVWNLRNYFRETVVTPSLRMLDLRQEFPSQWHRFLTPVNSAGPNIFEFEMSPSLFQIKDLNQTLKINTIWVLARCADSGVYEITLTPPLPAQPVGSNIFSLLKVSQYGGLHFSQKDVSVSGLEVVPSNPPVLWQLQMTGPLGANLVDKEVSDLIMVLGYQLDLD